MNWYLPFFVIYALLALHYWSNSPPTWEFRRRWFEIKPSESSRTENVDPTPCASHDDCPSGELCHAGECLPTRSAACNPLTGDWIVVQTRDGRRALHCTCKRPDLVTQKYSGGDCNVDVACGPHGYLASWIEPYACACEWGYADSKGSDPPTCRRLYAHQVPDPCLEGEIEGPPSPPYARAYASSLSFVRCHRPPCSFDVLTGRPLSGNSHDPSHGCVCDHARGHFGVRMDDSTMPLLESGYYNGCASIFERDPPDGALRGHVRAYAYFYVFDKDPVSFVRFDGLSGLLDHLQPVLRERLASGGADEIHLSQDWPHDFLQYALRTRDGPDALHFRLRRREIRTRYFWTEANDDVLKDDFLIVECSDLHLRVDPDSSAVESTYRLLYTHPACFVNLHDREWDERYRGRYVLNPFVLRWPYSPSAFRSNGLVLRLGDDGVWVLDYAPESFEMEKFRKNPQATTAPDLMGSRNVVRFVANDPAGINRLY